VALDRRTLLIAAAGLCAGRRRACADDFPVRPVEVIVPFAPGGGSDILARLVAEGIAREGAEVVGDAPDEFRAFIKDETERLARVIRAANIRLD